MATTTAVHPHVTPVRLERVQRPRGAQARARRTQAPRPAPVRLTLRGRVAAFTASIVALMAIVMVAGQVADASDDAPAVFDSVVVVQAGDTLWGMAREIAPEHDPRAVVEQIRDVNNLGTSAIVPGQSLMVPSLG